MNMRNWKKWVVRLLAVALIIQCTGITGLVSIKAQSLNADTAMQSKQIKDIAISKMLSEDPIGLTSTSLELTNTLSDILTEYEAMSILSDTIPVPVVYAEASDTTLNVSWNETVQAQGYEVALNSDASIYIKATSFKYENLEPNTQYSVKVRAISSLGTYGLIGDMNGDGEVDSLDFLQMGLYLQEPNGTPSEELLWVGDVDGDGVIDAIDYYLIRMYLLRMINYFPKSSVSQWSTDTLAHTLLSKPKGITTTPSSISIDIAWNEVNGASEYDIEIDGQIIDNGTSKTYIHDNLNQGTEHTYKIRGKNTDIYGEWSEPVQIWTLPEIPSNIRTTPSSISIDISWDEVVGASGYDIEVYGKPVDNGNSTTYTHTGLEANTQRTYRVRAKNSSGVGEWSNVFAAATLPASAVNLQVKATDNSLEVIWNPQAGALAYDLEIDGANILELTDTKYIHQGLASNSEHTYRVRSKNKVGTNDQYFVSDWSEYVKGIVLPSVPNNFKVATVTSSAITLDWEQVTGATGYEIEIDGQLIDNGLNTSYTHSELNSNEEHTYRVRALNGIIFGEWTELLKQATLLIAPTNLKATAANNKIEIKWDMVVGAERYQLEIDGQILEVGANTEYIQTELISGSIHTYRVRAVNSNGVGNWSTEVAQSVLLGIPDNIAALSQSTSITIGWSTVDGAATYDVMADGEIQSNISDNSFEHKDLKPNSMHVYMVRAVNSDCIGEWSSLQAFFTTVGIVSNVSTTSSSISIALSWDEVEGAASYDIMVDNEIINDITDTVYIHSGLSNNSQHSYKLRAKNEYGTGEWTETITQMTGSAVPANINAEAQLNQITLTWDKPEGAVSYEVEVDGEIIHDLLTEGYIDQGLEPNTRHEYRVRALNENAVCSEWSEVLEVNTTEELIINVDKDTGFNFVIAVPKKEGIDSYDIIVSYNSDDVEVIDLYAATQKLDLEVGQIEGTSNITVKEYSPGRIVFGVDNIEKSIMTIIRFLSKTNEDTSVSYTVE